MRYLLDKNIVRLAVVALRYGDKRELSKLERNSLAFIQQTYQNGDALFISDTSYNILQAWQTYREIQILYNLTNVFIPTRYYKRWSRRIRETSGLAPEDAAMIALGTFGCARHEQILGTDFIITCDQPMINGFEQSRDRLEERLVRMAQQLYIPFNQASLPHVIAPGRMI